MHLSNVIPSSSMRCHTESVRSVCLDVSSFYSPACNYTRTYSYLQSITTSISNSSYTALFALEPEAVTTLNYAAFAEKPKKILSTSLHAHKLERHSHPSYLIYSKSKHTNP
jgi:phosphoribosylformylglycinamidine (FGAM) synthase-like enzyme